MKNFTSFFSIVLIFLILTGCTNETSLQDDLTNKVITLETSEYKLTRLEISYDEFKEQIKNIRTDPNYYDEEFIFGTSKVFYSENDEDNMYHGKDLAGLSLEEINAIFEKLVVEDKSFRRMVEETKNMTREIKVSKTYDYPDYNWKYVYSQTKITINDGTEFYQNKRYRFVKQDGEWKIINVDGAWLKTDYNEKEMPFYKPKYDTFNNQPVEYIVTFNPLD